MYLGNIILYILYYNYIIRYQYFKEYLRNLSLTCAWTTMSNVELAKERPYSQQVNKYDLLTLEAAYFLSDEINNVCNYLVFV
jgi:hypothetical protein